MQAFGQSDERVVHVHLMDSLIGSAFTSEPGGMEGGLIWRGNEWRKSNRRES